MVFKLVYQARMFLPLLLRVRRAQVTRERRLALYALRRIDELEILKHICVLSGLW